MRDYKIIVAILILLELTLQYYKENEENFEVESQSLFYWN